MSDLALQPPLKGGGARTCRQLPKEKPNLNFNILFLLCQILLLLSRFPAFLKKETQKEGGRRECYPPSYPLSFLQEGRVPLPNFFSWLHLHQDGKRDPFVGTETQEALPPSAGLLPGFLLRRYPDLGPRFPPVWRAVLRFLSPYLAFGERKLDTRLIDPSQGRYSPLSFSSFHFFHSNSASLKASSNGRKG
jgi:hypothetical protein